MSSTGRGTGVLAAVACAVAVLLGAPPAGADTIEVKAGPLLPPQPSQADLSTSWQVGEPAFVGSVLLRGALPGCPADYAAAVALPGADPVVHEQAQAPGFPLSWGLPAVGEAGQFTTLPVGIYSLCGWIQQEGDAPGAVADAVAGPADLSVGGPTGSTDVISPATSQSESVQVPVGYTLALAAGEVPGLATASIGAWASPTPPGSCAGEPPAGTVFLGSSASRELTASGPPVEGTIDFTGRLRPGVWSVCAYLLQNMVIPPTVTGLPNVVMSEAFGYSSGTVTVLGPPRISAMRARPRSIRHGHATTLELSLDQGAVVTLKVARLLPGGAGPSRRCLTDPATRRRVCGRTAPALSLRIQAHAGADTVRLGSHLRPGLYVVSALPRAADGTAGARASTVFTVLR